MDRRTFLSTIAAAGAAAASGVRTEAEPAKQAAGAPHAKAPANAPNVLIFMPDQQNGATVLPGSPVIKPNLDRFRKESTTFTAAHCPAPHCCPSRATFLTGLYPSEHGVYNDVTTDTAIHPNPYPGTPFWGTWLRDAGYAMGYAGKIHVGRDITPEDCGFENLSHLEQGSLRSNKAHKSAVWKQAAEQKSEPEHRKDGNILRPMWSNLQMYRTLPDERFETLDDTKVVNAGVEGIKRFAATGKPWCMMVSNSGGHDPYDVPKRFVDMYDLKNIELPPSFGDMMDDKPRIYQRQRYQYWAQLSDDETRDAIRHYYAKCTMQDELFGRLLAALETSGQAENTIVLYVSDHGDYMGAHGVWFKGIPSFREAYHIPTIIRWPKGTRNAGREVSELVDQVDFASTVLEACGVQPKAKLSGRSLMPFLRGEAPADWRRATCSQMNGAGLYYTQRIVMTKEWKYVYNDFDYDEMYDLKNDPHEMRNLAFPDLAKKSEEVRSGKGLGRDASVPWPPLSEKLEAVRRDLLKEMWTFAAEHRDIIFTPYGTVALAPYGPGLGETASEQK